MQVRFHYALSLYPIQRRIDELLLIFRECTIKELQIFYSTLIENIFGGSATTPGWNLKTITRYDAVTSFEAIFRFLHPQGPVFDIAYKLLSDPFLKFNYSLSYLPPDFQQLIQSGSVPPFYAEKLTSDPYTKTLLLNPFEFYLFHFAFHLVLPWQVRKEGLAKSSNETVYLHLSDQYLSHFLPIETSVVMPIISLHQGSQRWPPPQVQPIRVSTIFKSSPQKLNSSAHAHSASQPHAEIWRSETLLHIIIYFWLYVADKSRIHDKSQLSASRSAYSSFNSSDASMHRQFSLEWFETRATDDHLRVVRNLIKHMHYFANNMKNDGSSMDSMRRSIRDVLKLPIYNFLRHNIYNWPLDSSFLILLETYLSYIQPWRYQHYDSAVAVDCGELYTTALVFNVILHGFKEINSIVAMTTHEFFKSYSSLIPCKKALKTRAFQAKKQSRTQAGQSAHVDSSWMQYIKDNLEAYTAIVSQILSRFMRIDLSSPRHAQMIYRLAKVLFEPDLPLLLRQADVSAQSRGDQENHVPLFTYETEQKVWELLRTMKNTIAMVSSAERDAQTKPSRSLKQILREWLLSGNENNSSTDRQVTVAYLEPAVHWLSTIFNVTPPDVTAEPGTDSSVEPSLLDPVFVQKRAARFKYSGNPDLEPIRSTEVASLYGDQIAELWHRSDLTGRIAKLFIEPPCQYFYFNKTGPGNPAPRVPVFLPPRLCLRPLASYKSIFRILLIILIPFVFGYTPVLFYLISFVVFAIVVVIRAFLAPYFEREACSFESTPFVPSDQSFQE